MQVHVCTCSYVVSDSPTQHGRALQHRLRLQTLADLAAILVQREAVATVHVADDGRAARLCLSGVFRPTPAAAAACEPAP